MAGIGDLIAKLGLDNSGFKKGLDSSRSLLSTFANGVTSMFAPVSAALAGITGGISIGFGVKLAAEMETMQVQMAVLTGSADVAADLLESLRKMGAQTPFETADLVKATTTLLAFGRTAADVQADLEMLTNIAAGDANKLGSLSLVFGQIASAGKLTGGDLLQLINQGFNPLNQISQKTGESISDLRDRMSKGAITFGEVRQAFQDATSEGGLFYQMNEKQAATLAGRFSTLKDAINTALMEMGQEIIKGANIKEMVSQATIYMERFKGVVISGFGTAVELAARFGPHLLGIAVAIKAVNSVLAIWAARQQIVAKGQALILALSGPKGWASLAAGVAIYAGSLAALKIAVDDVTAAADGMNGALTVEPIKFTQVGFEDVQQPSGTPGLAAEQIQTLKDEIALLNGETTEAQLKVRDLLSEGVTQSEALQVSGLMAMKEAIQERQKLAQEAEKAEDMLRSTLENRATSLIDATRTPMEEFRQRVQEMQELLAQGLIDEDTFARGMKQAEQDMRRDRRERQRADLNAALAGTQEAASIMLSGLGGGSESIESIAIKQLGVQEEILAEMRKRNPVDWRSKPRDQWTPEQREKFQQEAPGQQPPKQEPVKPRPPAKGWKWDEQRQAWIGPEFWVNPTTASMPAGSAFRGASQDATQKQQLAVQQQILAATKGNKPQAIVPLTLGMA